MHSVERRTRYQSVVSLDHNNGTRFLLSEDTLNIIAYRLIPETDSSVVNINKRSWFPIEQV